MPEAKPGEPDAPAHSAINSAETQPSAAAEQQSDGHSNGHDADHNEVVAYMRMNFMMLLHDQLGTQAIQQLAQQAARRRQHHADSFQQYLSQLIASFRAQRAQTDNDDFPPPANFLDGWPVATIQQIRQQHQGLLIALFHFGEHRHVAVDMAAQGLNMVAPIAGQAFWDYYQLRNLGPAVLANSIQLLEVEQHNVGRKLVLALKRGDIGVIYVDGNMGPDGTKVQEGGVGVHFLGREIQVKAGIARMAQSFGLPILPLFVRRKTIDDQCHTTALNSYVHLGKLVAPATKHDLKQGRVDKDADLERLMQSLYTQLGAEVQRDPANWEFALCFHRWLQRPNENEIDAQQTGDQSADPTGIASPVNLGQQPDQLRLCMDKERVTPLFSKGQLIWIDIQRQKGFKADASHQALLERLNSDEGIQLGTIKHQANPQRRDDELELLTELMHKGLVKRVALES
jgi:lauroyl/myristoyl acyltransferase